MKVKSNENVALTLAAFCICGLSFVSSASAQIQPGSMYTAKVQSMRGGTATACFAFQENNVLEVTVVPMQKMLATETTNGTDPVTDCPRCMASGQSGSWTQSTATSSSGTPMIFFEALLTGYSDTGATASNTYLGTTMPDAESPIAGLIESKTLLRGTQVSPFTGVLDSDCLEKMMEATSKSEPSSY